MKLYSLTLVEIQVYFDSFQGVDGMRAAAGALSASGDSYQNNVSE